MRKSRIALLLAGALAVGAAGYAISQGIVPLASPSGTELLAVVPIQANGQPGAVQAQITLNQIRNTTGYQLTSATTGTVNTTLATDNLIFTAAATTVTANLPANPPDGFIFSVVNGTGAAFAGTITVATTDGSTIANGATSTNLAAAGSQEWQYTIGSKVWYRMR